MIANLPSSESPVSTALRAGPRGNGDWPGFSHVYTKIQEGCHKMATTPYVRLSFDHVQAMADLGSGHEERMKARLMWLRDCNFIP